MEANRDAAAQSLIVALRAQSEGHVDKALKFARKSQDLFPTPQATLLLSQLQSAQAAEPEPSVPASSGAAAASSSKAAQSSSSKPPPAAPSAPSAPQSELVRRILGAPSYYDVLSVAWSAEETEIRKAYRKLAIQLHPDKNDSPGAEEAFKKVGEAVTTLSDVNKRFTYNMKLQTEKVMQQQAAAVAGRARQKTGKQIGVPMGVPRPPPPRPQPPPPRPPPEPVHPLPPGVPERSNYTITCSKCSAGLQVKLPNHVGTDIKQHSVRCPSCSNITVAAVRPCAQPVGSVAPSRAAANAPKWMPQQSAKRPQPPAESKAAPPATAAAAKSRAQPKRAATKAPAKRKKKKAVWSDSEEEEEEEEEEDWDQSSASEGGEGAGDGDEAGGSDGGNDDQCHYCTDKGEEGSWLVMCDSCPRSFHFECLIPPIRKKDLPEGEWYCPICVAEKAGSGEKAEPGIHIEPIVEPLD